MLNLGFSKVGAKNYTAVKQTHTVAPTNSNPLVKYATDKKEPVQKPVVYVGGGTGVQFGAFSSYTSAQNQAKKVKSATGLDANIEQNESGLYRVRVNGLSESAAQNAKNSALANGIDCYIFH